MAIALAVTEELKEALIAFRNNVSYLLSTTFNNRL